MEETKSPMTQQQKRDFVYTGSINIEIIHYLNPYLLPH